MRTPPFLLQEVAQEAAVEEKRGEITNGRAAAFSHGFFLRSNTIFYLKWETWNHSAPGQIQANTNIFVT